MMKDYAQRAKRKEKGDGFSVTLLCFGAVLVAIAVHALTERFIAFQDRLAVFAPADARIYVHANGAAAAKLMELAAPHVAVGPREAAVFSRPDGDGDAWTTLLAWQLPFGPSEREAALLAGAGAVSLGDGRYALGGATADSARLIDVPSVSRALASVRDRAAIQAYVADPTMLTGLPGASDEAAPTPLFAAAGPRVAWLLLRDDLFSITVMPVDVAAGRGRRLRDARQSGGATELPAGAPSADIVLREETLSVDLLAVIVDRIATGDRTAATGPAADRLRKTLSGPVVVSLHRDAARKHVDFAFHFPTLPRTKLESDMADFLASAWPTRHMTTLPDGDVSVEYRIDPTRYRFSAVSTYPGVAAVQAGPADSPLYAADDGRSGSLLASEHALLIEAKEAALSTRRNQACPSGGRGSMTLHRPGNLFADEPHLLGLFGALTTSTVTVTDLGDNILRICGYSRTTVDK